MKTTDKVRIRMYRQGLGDCFLLTFYSGNEKTFNMLVDCGILSTSQADADKMKEIAEDIQSETNKSIDVLVATHAHWDHISGFVQAEKEFKQIKIKEIWLPWTEDPDDDFGKSINESNNLKLKTIQNAFNIMDKKKASSFAAVGANQIAGFQTYLNAFSSFFEFYGIDTGGNAGVFQISKTKEAIEWLKKNNPKPNYQTPKSEYIIQKSKIPDIRFYILGPPKDLKLLKKMDPSRKNSEVYELMYNLSAWDSFCTALGDEPDPNIPFNNVRCYNEKEAHDFAESYFSEKDTWRRIDNDWLFTASLMAFSLDDVVNNTSLTLAIEFVKSGKVLLFAADAQVGNWLSWKNYKWTIKKNGRDVEVTIDDLISRTVFYKVGHHGSHNATLRAEGLEKMTDKNLIAMLPVDKKMARQRGWNKMPFVPLVNALLDKTGGKVISMDENYPGTIGKAIRGNIGQKPSYYEVIIKN
jgi:predicted metallo-beta-lactamase superfamily hydrolase